MDSSFSSGEEEIASFAEPSPTELAKQAQKRAFRKLPKAQQQELRSAAVRAKKDRYRARQQQQTPQLPARPVDPLADVSSAFANVEGIQSLPVPAQETAIRNPFNRAVYEFAGSCFPFFRTHCNLLTGSSEAFAVRESGELQVFLHEEVTTNRVLYGLGVTGTVGKVREVRLFKVAE